MENISINYEAGAVELIAQLFAPPPSEAEIAQLAGALDGARVDVSVRRVGLFLAVAHPWFECYETSIRRDRNGDLYAYIHDVRKHTREPREIAIKAFLRQVTAARKLGLKRFELYAAGTAADTKFSGYRFWPRLGFNAALYDFELNDLPPSLIEAGNLNDLMQRPLGYEWWKRKGSERSMIFDLAAESAMMKVFRHRLQELGLKEDE